LTHTHPPWIAFLLYFSNTQRGDYLKFDFDVIAIDEIHYFDDGIVQVCNDLANSGKIIIIAGLHIDFRGEAFGNHITFLLATADELVLLEAICAICGKPAKRHQRLVKGQPAKWTDPIFVEDRSVTYQAVCRKHHRIELPLGDQISEGYFVVPKTT